MIGKLATFALVAGLVSAIHEPVGEPKGNAFRKPALGEIVPACKPYTITWDADTPNKVSLQLLRGPSENIVPLGAPLAEGIANTGKFEWTPSADLEADTTHYGLRIIDDVNGQFQWSSQFGISKDSNCVGKANTTSSGTASLSGYPTKTSSVVTSSATSSHASVTKSASAVTSTGAPVNSTIVLPTGSMTVPNSLRTTVTPAASSATGTPVATPTGAAGHVQAGLGLAGAIAGLVMML